MKKRQYKRRPGVIDDILHLKPVGWIAMGATATLGVMIYLIVVAAWNKLEFWGQLVFFLCIFTVVIVLGYRESGPTRGFVDKRYLGNY